jgi:hypothetical protein
LTPGSFKIAHEAPCAYDVAAWWLHRPRRDLKFHDVDSSTQAETLAPPPCHVYKKERQCHRQRRLAIVEADERTMVVWPENFPQDVVDENAFFA